MNSLDLRAMEARLGRRLTRDEIARLRDDIDRADRIDRHIESSLAAFRRADPAAVSSTWGTA